jgi:hypothetical protein
VPLSTRRTAIGQIDMTVTAVVLLACFVPAVLMAQTNPAAAAARLASAARARYR